MGTQGDPNWTGVQEGEAAGHFYQARYSEGCYGGLRLTCLGGPLLFTHPAAGC